MLDIGFGELILLAAIALIALGPKQLPEVARSVARFINEMKRIASGVAGSIIDARDETDRRMSAPRPPARAPAPTPTPTPEVHHEARPRFVMHPEREEISAEEEEARRRQMSFPMFEAPAHHGNPRHG